MKILIIDDDELNREILANILSDHGYDFTVAEDGASGLAALKADSALKIILLDRMMPGMDGMAFIEAVNADSALGPTKIIMQTAANQPKDVLEGNASGVYYYLTKPFDEEIVLSIIRAAEEDLRLMG